MKIELRKRRVDIMNTLYQYDLYKDGDIPFVPSFEDQDIAEIYTDIICHFDEIDGLIKEHLYHYTIDRLSYVDRAIIRLATYELLMHDTPKEIVINEALELTKEYTNLDDEKQRKFNNKLLDNIANALKE